MRDERSSSSAGLNGQAQNRQKQSLNVNKFRQRNSRKKQPSFGGSNGFADEEEPEEGMSIEDDMIMRDDNPIGGPFNNEESDYE